MGKAIITFFLFLGINFGVTYYFLFTAGGNEIIEPYVEKFIDKKFDKGIEIEKFRLKMDYLTLTLLIDDQASLNIDGPFHFFSKKLDLNYHFLGKNMQLEGATVDGTIDVSGRAEHTLKEMHITGQGVFVDKKIRYNLDLIDKVIKNMLLDIETTDGKRVSVTILDDSTVTNIIKDHLLN
jgi:hypothetical protein